MLIIKPHNHLKQHSTTPEFCIVQLSDLHLTGSIGTAPSYQRFLQVLAQAVKCQPDLWLLTGDLVNDGNSNAYDWLFAELDKTGVAHFAIAGNHDVTHEIGIHLPFDERLHIAICADDRLWTHRQLQLDIAHGWQVLLLNSSVAGCTHGHLSKQTLAWLDDILGISNLPTIIAMHHHPATVGSAWIDAYMLDNADKFWQIIQKNQHVHTIICGHVHQAHHLKPLPDHPVQLLTCPATDRQFLPFAHEFAIDTAASGFRQLQITHTGRLITQLHRLE